MRHIGIPVHCTEDRRCSTRRASGSNFMCDVTIPNVVLFMRQRICHSVEMAIWRSIGKGVALALAIRGSRRCRERTGGARLDGGRGLMSSAILRSFGAFLLEY